MVFVEKSLQKMLKEIELTSITRKDTLIPAENPSTYKFYKGKLDGIKEEYAHDLLEKIIPGYDRSAWHDGFDESDMYLYTASILLALENAFFRGNKGKVNLPVSLKVYSGYKGHVISITDSGDGFDYKTKIEKMRFGDKGYAEGAGEGLRILEKVKFEVSYGKKGRRVNIMMKKSQFKR